ncbi:hypothetical protein niasHT_032988 [Heterodera trifolii]|uniref:Uncharacterized protein n=1 Tax=Heterodera trifolii TaxID=157864 RepID=A0ABD2I7G5_9BILA
MSHRTTGWFKNGITAAASIKFIFSQNALIYEHSFKESLQTDSSVTVYCICLTGISNLLVGRGFAHAHTCQHKRQPHLCLRPHLHKSINSPNLCNNSKAACLLFDGCYKLEKLRPPKGTPAATITVQSKPNAIASTLPRRPRPKERNCYKIPKNGKVKNTSLLDVLKIKRQHSAA